MGQNFPKRFFYWKRFKIDSKQHIYNDFHHSYMFWPFFHHGKHAGKKIVKTQHNSRLFISATVQVQLNNFFRVY